MDKKKIIIRGGNPDQIENLRHRIDCWNKIKYPDDKELRITFVTLKPEGTVTTAPKNKE